MGPPRAWPGPGQQAGTEMDLACGICSAQLLNKDPRVLLEERDRAKLGSELHTGGTGSGRTSPSVHARLWQFLSASGGGRHSMDCEHALTGSSLR